MGHRNGWSRDSWLRTAVGTFALGRMDLLLQGFADAGARDRVLEVGCGTGLYARALAEQGLEASEVDPAEAVHLPHPSGSRDLVLIQQVEFTPDPAAAVKEGIRVLARYGRLLAGSVVRGSAWAEFLMGQLDPSAPEPAFLARSELARLYTDLYAQRVGALYLTPSELAALPPEEWAEAERRAEASGERQPSYVLARWDVPDTLANYVHFTDSPPEGGD